MDFKELNRWMLFVDNGRYSDNISLTFVETTKIILLNSLCKTGRLSLAKCHRDVFIQSRCSDLSCHVLKDFFAVVVL